MTSGIYCIENLINGKKYIGQSERLEIRKKWHFSVLEKGNHDNAHLQNAYNKYGKENFIFSVLISCKSFELTKYEQLFINSCSSDCLYNLRLECVNSNLGIKWSDESRKRASENHADFSGENHPLFGKHHTKETRKKLSDSHKGLQAGENHPLYGKHHNKETKMKIGASRIGKKLTPEHKEKLKGRIPWNKGRGKKYEPKPPMISKPRKPMPEEWRKKKSLEMSGKNNPMYGKTLSKESLEKRNETRRRNRELKSSPE